MNEPGILVRPNVRLQARAAAGASPCKPLFDARSPAPLVITIGVLAMGFLPARTPGDPEVTMGHR